MSAFTIIFLLLAVLIMPVRLESRFTQEELVEMGIKLDSSPIVETR